MTLMQLTHMGHNSATSLETKVQYMNDLRHHMTDIWAGMEHGVIVDGSMPLPDH